MTFDRHDRRALLRTCLLFALRNPGLWPSGLAFAARKLWRLRRGLLASRGRLSFHIHSFMDADRLERARCESCVFMAMTRDGPISMCIHNAKRDHFILQPVMVEGEYRGAWWTPLDGTVDGRPTTTIPDPKDHALKRLKGRMRRQVFEDRSQVRSV